MSTATARAPEGLTALLPGFALAGAVAVGAFALKWLPIPMIATISPLMLAILLGMAVRNTIGTPDSAHPGLAACLRRPLRFGIVLLGLQLTLAQVLEVGGAGLLILVVAVAGTYAF